MRIKVVSLIVLLLAGGGISCGNKKLPDSGHESSLIDTIKKEEMYVWVENARIRKNPDLNAEVITEIKGGEKLTLTGEVSENKSKVKLRGVDFEDVWVKVTTVDGKEGWIFKPMLTEDEEKATAMNDFLIQPGTGVGHVKLSSTLQENEKIFGKEFISKGEIYFAEGESSPGFYLFKNSPMELQCPLNEQGKISGIMIRQPGGYWATPEGIKIGTTLDQLAKLNEKPIKFSGFGWDYGGGIYDFSGGKLSKYQESLRMYLGEPDNLEGLDEFMGDVECSSTNKKILGKGVKVVEISVYAGTVL